MKHIFNFAWLLIPAMLIFASCDKTETSPPAPDDPLSEYTLIGEESATTLGYTLKLYAGENLFVGYNYMLVKVTNTSSKEVVENATITFKPVMSMTSMTHTTPTEQPIFNSSLNVYEGTTTFIMPTTAMGTWTYEIIVKDGQGNEETVTFAITVIEKSEKVFYSFLSDHDNTTTLIVALVGPLKPEVGINDYEIVIYEKKTMMDFPAMENLTVEIEPIMPSMGHGSPNNVNPTHVTNGHYMGKVNFTMTGYWKIDQVIKTPASGTIMNDAGYFDITL